TREHLDHAGPLRAPDAGERGRGSWAAGRLPRACSYARAASRRRGLTCQITCQKSRNPVRAAEYPISGSSRVPCPNMRFFEYYAGVVWDGIRKKPVMLFSDMGGIDIEEVEATHPEHIGRGHLSNLVEVPDYRAKEVVAQTGVTGRQLTRITPILARLARLFAE